MSDPSRRHKSLTDIGAVGLPWCCERICPRLATWRIEWGDGAPERGNTDTCDRHLMELLPETGGWVVPLRVSAIHQLAAIAPKDYSPSPLSTLLPIWKQLRGNSP